ncbi:TraR/DksA C4-type zinc finger protein [bacterium]|nr:TraR/DksA C4-type zinc finger protein [bacterium]
MGKNNKLTKAERAKFKKLLIDYRTALVGDLNHLEDNALSSRREDAATLDISNFADLGTDNFEKDLAIGLIENSEETLREIDAALMRMEAGGYGVCEESGDPIGQNRLQAIPWARLCIDCQRKAEEEAEG